MFVLPITITNPNELLSFIAYRKRLPDNVKTKLFNVIISHLSEDSKGILKEQGIDTEDYGPPLFNYISLWRHLNLRLLDDMIYLRKTKDSNMNIIRNEIYKLFINKNSKFISLFIPAKLEIQIDNFPDADKCFSFLELFKCDSSIKKPILIGMSNIITSIKKIKIENLYHGKIVNSGFDKLIKAQKNLKQVCLLGDSKKKNEISLEDLLKNNVNHIQHINLGWNPNTEFLSHFANLISLKIYMKSNNLENNHFHLKSLNLPNIKYLKISGVPVEILADMIDNSGGHLVEINIKETNDRLIKSIYKKCKNLKYLELSIENKNLLEFENLLINYWDKRHPMLLKLNTFWMKKALQSQKLYREICNIVERYKSKGTVRKIEFLDCDNFLEDIDSLEWLKKKSRLYREY
ncbi:23077_t:CDS:2 [Rhizophagus irregularis]|nr:23077_t:CDS:2 [Rhizophagus irregularis]